ncbi:hypothetical protein E2C01_064547 [Portunus trituberculatus]|uniref:Uncharacterized protein n=1 Tax=Portunus trituberculatus TaxID=210409 RepID=A0A5B7HJF1_PORTR|nr:hypothetical protein [Portunus trituberculatus]
MHKIVNLLTTAAQLAEGGEGEARSLCLQPRESHQEKSYKEDFMDGDSFSNDFPPPPPYLSPHLV